jgi:MtN3 and saliva related transmembrane protein
MKLYMTLTTEIVQLGFSISLLVNSLLFIPQIMTILKHKSAENVSLITFAGFNTIQLFILLHGLLNQDYLLAAGYLLSLLSCGTVTMLIIYYRYIRPPHKYT